MTGQVAAGRRRRRACSPIRRACCACLCAALGIPYSEAMLRWPPGPRATDGVWAAHWYDAVNRSTGFAPAAPAPSWTIRTSCGWRKQALPIYERLSRSSRA